MDAYNGFSFTDIQKFVRSNDEHGVPQSALSQQAKEEVSVENGETVPTRQETPQKPPETHAVQDKPQETAGRRGRKSAPGRKSKTAAKPVQSEELTMKGIYFDEKLHMRMKLYCTQAHISVSSFVNSCTDDAMNRSYTCLSPACRCSFTLRATTDEAALTPSCCPVCGGNSLEKNDMK